jgi:hypothetical protein
MAQIATDRRSPGTARLPRDVVERISEVLESWADELRRQDPTPLDRRR